MGCDIHSFVEYHTAGAREAWYFGTFDIGRNYVLFGLLAGVRCGGCLFQPRGLPDDMSFTLRYNASLRVCEEGSDGCISREEADGLEACELNKFGGYVDGTKMFVWNPDFHTHSWLSCEELQQVQSAYSAIDGAESPTLAAVLAAMNSLESSGVRSRFVFYFDS